jgi:hypothetical protein
MILEACRKNAWSYDTPNIAGRVYNILKPFGYSKRTLQDYIRTIVDLLETEKKKHRKTELA